MATTPELRLDRWPTKALQRFDADRLRWLDEAAALGPIAVVKLGPIRMFVVSDPQTARDMLVTDTASWMRPPAVLAPIRVGGGENLFTQSDKAWALLQPSVSPAFRRKALEERLGEIERVVESEVRALPRDTTVDLELAMGRITLRLAAWVLLGEELDAGRAEEIARHQREVVRWVGVQLGRLTGALPLAPGRRGREMKRHRAALHAYVDEVVARAATSGRAADDVLGALMNARPGGKALSHDQLRSHVLGLFFAGNETTTAALSWALVHGARTPLEWAKLRVDPARWTVPFIDETLRLTPAVWGLPRTPTKPGVTLTSGGHSVRVRRGQPVNVYLRAINRDPRLWDDPLSFDPSRHETASKEQQRALLPFGLGPRGCIGQQLAIAEMAAALPALARHGSITVDGPTDEDPSFALRVRGGLHGRFETEVTRGCNTPSG